MKDFLFGMGYLLITVGGFSFGGALVYGFKTNKGMPLGIMSGVCLLVAAICFWRVHQKGGIDIWGGIWDLKDDPEGVKRPDNDG